MKFNKIIVLSMLVAGLTGQTQAAVYGSLNQDIAVVTEAGEVVTRESGEGISILEVTEEDYVILVKDGITKSVNKDIVDINGVISQTTVNETKLRKTVDAESEVLTYLDANALIMALEKEGQFYKVKVDDTVGYIHKSQLDETKLTDVKEKKSKGQEVVDYAKQFVGGRYVYGGNNLATGVDCSGFTSQIMKKFGVNLQRTSRDQYSTNGVRVSVDNLQPGDLVFYGYSGHISHVAIYAGDGQIVHASDSRTGIRMSSLYYGTPLIGCKRVI